MPWIWLDNFNSPAVRVESATNMQFVGIGIGFPWKNTGMVACGGLPEFPSRWTCPVLHIYRGWAVTFSNGQVQGRTDVYRSGAVEFSYQKHVVDYLDGTLFSYSCIRFAVNGDPVNLIRSLNKVVNSEIRGAWTSIMINVADCMLNTIQDNYIIPGPAYPTNNGDGAGIYYDLHWYNPGESAERVAAPSVPLPLTPPSALPTPAQHPFPFAHCFFPHSPSRAPRSTLPRLSLISVPLSLSPTFPSPSRPRLHPWRRQSGHVQLHRGARRTVTYLDFTTSGLTIDGAVCIRNHDGIKVNTGHALPASSTPLILHSPHPTHQQPTQPTQCAGGPLLPAFPLLPYPSPSCPLPLCPLLAALVPRASSNKVQSYLVVNPQWQSGIMS
ncbi:unnamed protein product, partial [Closterium sp. NIES-64]